MLVLLLLMAEMPNQRGILFIVLRRPCSIWRPDHTKANEIAGHVKLAYVWSSVREDDGHTN